MDAFLADFGLETAGFMDHDNKQFTGVEVAKVDRTEVTDADVRSATQGLLGRTLRIDEIENFPAFSVVDPDAKPLNQGLGDLEAQSDPFEQSRTRDVESKDDEIQASYNMHFIYALVILGLISIGIIAVSVFFADNSEAEEGTEALIKSPADTNDYRVIELSNGLTVMLVSDSKTDSSAAAIDYGAGSFFDIFTGADGKKEGTAGLAHFHEHMLFLGSKEYPGEDEFNGLLSKYNGQDNAYTAEEHTNFHFQCHNEGFYEVLQVWAAFFKAPLMTESAMYREMNQVHSEYTKDVPQDGWREWTMLKQTGRAGHPFKKFDIGSIETLNKTDIHKWLVDWHNKFFSAKIAMMAVYSNETLDTLQGWVEGVFHDISAHDLDYPLVDGNPYGSEDLLKKYWIMPLNDENTLQIAWEIPVTYYKYRVPALEWIFSMIDFKGPGGLKDNLVQRDLATAVTADETTTARTFGIIYVGVKLTSTGLSHVDEIVNLVLQYIRLILKNGLEDDWRFDDYKALDEFNWQYYTRPEGSLYSFVSGIAEHMHFREPQDMLYPQFTCPPERYKWDKGLITTVLEALAPEKLILLLFTKQHNFTNHETEHFFQIPNQVESIPNTTVEKWRSTDISADLKLPPKNLWTIQDTSLYADPNVTNPTIIYEQGKALVRGWFGYNTDKHVPKVLVSFIFRNKLIRQSARSFILAKMFKKLIVYNFQVEFSQAIEADYGVSIELGNDGLAFSFSGYNDHMVRLVDKFFQLVFSSEDMRITDLLFDSLKSDMKNAMGSDQQGPAYTQTRSTFFHVTMENVYPLSEQMHELKTITQDEVMDFIDELQGNMQAEYYVYGNADEDFAVEIGSKVDLIVDTKMVQYGVRHRKVPLGINILQKRNKNPEDKNSASDVYIQVSSDKELKHVVLLDMLVPLLKEKAFDSLRTKQTLGYIVSAGGGSYGYVLYARIIVVGPKHDSTEFLERINVFLDEFNTAQISNMSEKAFGQLKEAASKGYSRTDLSLSQKHDIVVAELENTEYDFEHRKKKKEIADSLKIEDLQDFYEKFFLSDQRRILSIQLFAETRNQTLPEIPHMILADESALSDDGSYEHVINMERYQPVI